MSNAYGMSALELFGRLKGDNEYPARRPLSALAKASVARASRLLDDVVTRQRRRAVVQELKGKIIGKGYRKRRSSVKKTRRHTRKVYR